MDAIMEKIWKAVKGLDQADVHSAALCHSIINLMITQGVVTKEEVALQIEKSVAKVVLVHKKIVKAMNEQSAGAGGIEGRQTLH
jgi:hypothetical protein